MNIEFPGPDRRLAGTLTLPAGPGPFPAALLICGSGPLDRDSNHRRARLGVTAQLAEALAAAGFASLRYDKRGVGGSGTDWKRAGLYDNADDASAALDALTGRPEVSSLAVNGTKDLQVNPDDLDRIAALLPGPVETWAAPDVTHMLRVQPGPASLRAYRKEILKPVDAGLLAHVTDWLTRQTMAGRPRQP